MSIRLGPKAATVAPGHIDEDGPGLAVVPVVALRPAAAALAGAEANAATMTRAASTNVAGCRSQWPGLPLMIRFIALLSLL